MGKSRKSNVDVGVDNFSTDYKGDAQQQQPTFQRDNFHFLLVQQSRTGNDDGDFLRHSSKGILRNNDTEEETDQRQNFHSSESKNIRCGEIEKDNNSFASKNSGSSLNRWPETMKSVRRPRNGRRVPFSSSFWMSLTITFLATTLILLSSNVDLVSSCNEAVCASIVSKCTLTQACKCELKNCTCCKECFDCLTYLYDECCSCVELCPKPNITHHVIMHSQVGDLKEPIDELFKALTEEKDIQGRWATFTYPIDIDQSWFMPKPEVASSATAYTVGKIVVDPSKEVVTVNCTVAYMSECMPLNKCKNSCHSMGASYFRWFHDGCCECIGSTCINYGIDESRCSKCSSEDDAEDDPVDSESQDENDNNDTTGKEA